MISLKKYLDMETDRSDLAGALLESYRSALLAMGKSGVRACPAVGSDLQRGLAGLEKRLSTEVTTAQVKGTGNMSRSSYINGETAVRNISRPRPTKSRNVSWCWPARQKAWANATNAKLSTSVSSPRGCRALRAWKTWRGCVHRWCREQLELRGYVDQMAHDSKKSVA